MQVHFSSNSYFLHEKKTAIHHHFTYRKHTSQELLEKLEDMLKEKKMQPTGLDVLTMPDRAWIQNAILNVDPTDPLGLLESHIQQKQSYKLQVNEE